jgi:hypothetical protein
VLRGIRLNHPPGCMRTWYAIVAHLPVSSWNTDSRSSAAKLWKTFPLGGLKPIVSGHRNAGRPSFTNIIKENSNV